MSVVTNVILVMGVGDERMLDEVNKHFSENEYYPEFAGKKVFYDLHEDAYGGNKHLETVVAVAAINKLDLDGLIYHLARLYRQFEWKKELQLLIKGQDDDQFYDAWALYLKDNKAALVP